MEAVMDSVITNARTCVKGLLEQTLISKHLSILLSFSGLVLAFSLSHIDR